MVWYGKVMYGTVPYRTVRYSTGKSDRIELIDWLIQLPSKEDEPRKRKLWDMMYGGILYGRFYSERQGVHSCSSGERCVEIRVLTEGLPRGFSVQRTLEDYSSSNLQSCKFHDCDIKSWSSRNSPSRIEHGSTNSKTSALTISTCLAYT